VPALRQALTRLGHKNTPIVIGGVIPPQDYDELYRDGALAIFGPGTAIPTAGLKILEILEHQARQAPTGAMEAGKAL
jgi:methylmalonyl-CoA mutase